MLGPIAFAFPSSSLIIEISSSFSWVNRDIVVFSIIYSVVCLWLKDLVEAAGIEPASAGSLLLALHA